MKNGLNKGKCSCCGESLKKHVEEAKQTFITNALEKLGLLLDSPTASGSAGTSGTYILIHFIFDTLITHLLATKSTLIL